MNLRILPTFGCLAFFALVAQSSGGQEQTPPTGEQIEKWVHDLDASQFSVREQATRDLLRAKERALAPLHEAMKTNNSLEFRRRTAMILEKLAIYEPGGQVVAGLKVRLTIDRESVRMGDTVIFTTSLANMTDQPMNLQVGFTTCGNYFECGSVLCRKAPGNKDSEPKWIVGFCGTGAKGILATLPAKSVKQFQVPGKLTSRDGKAVLLLGKSAYAIQALEEKGPTTFRIVFQNQGVPPKGPVGGKYVPDPPANPDAPYWNGIARSNEVTLKILP
jgi:hypothetical protein